MKHPRHLLRIPALILSAVVALPQLAASVYELKNNHPFPLRAPVTITAPLPDGAWKTDGGAIAQSLDGELHLVAEIPASGETRFALASAPVKAAAPASKNAPLAISASGHAATLRFNNRDLGRLSWGLVLKPLAATPGSPSGAVRLPALPLDYEAEFSALPLRLHKANSGPVFDLWKATVDNAADTGLSCTIVLRVYHAGFLDIETSLANHSADAGKKVYCALVCRWEQPETPARTLDYNNHIQPISEKAYSPFRAGTTREVYLQRGADWIRSDFQDGASVAWKNEFSDTFLLTDMSTGNFFGQPRHAGSSLPQLGREIQTSGRTLYSITEIARPRPPYSPTRGLDNLLPEKGDVVTFASRMSFTNTPPGDARTTQMFLGYTSVRSQTRAGDGRTTRLAWGVPHVRFGTSYFPYSTLGENFDRKKLPGMDREEFWPLAADTVLRWREFAGEIKRDLRLAKGMGFDTIRLHHIELLAPIPAEIRREYLDFLFDELRHLGLKAMADVYGTPESIVELVKRYGDVIDTVEIENEILICGIPMDRPAQWTAIYHAVKKAAPHIQVHLTGYINMAVFDRLNKLGVPCDNVSMHIYTDSVEAMPNGRGYALATARRASKENKPAVATEWNWRHLTRFSPEQRAEFTRQVYDIALATRTFTEMHQFQFNETLAVNPRVGRGNILRHYELVNLSRRLKLDALAFMQLIKQYSAPTHPARFIEASPVIVDLTPQGQGKARISIKNLSTRPLRLSLALETPAEMQATLLSEGSANHPSEPQHRTTLNLQPGEITPLEIDIKTTGSTPGFYHGFIRIEDFEAGGANNNLLHYTWFEARLAGQPRMDTATQSDVIYPRGIATELDIDFTKPCAVVYAHDSTVLEAETAIAIAGTLESATGRPIEALSSDTLTPGHRARMTIIAVGTNEKLMEIAKTIGVPGREQLQVNQRPHVHRIASASAQPATLLIGGADANAAKDAGMDFLLRYWIYAKDSAARRAGLIEKELPLNFDPTMLP